jgi:hypothetical protein
MKVSEMLDSRFLKQSDVPVEMTVTIEAVAKKNISREDEDPEIKVLVKFKEFAKPMVLNKTNVKRLQQACGSDESNDWKGKTVRLYVDPDVEYAGNVVGGLRIRGSAAQSAVAGAASMEDDIPF